MDPVISRIRTTLARTSSHAIVGGWAALYLHGVRHPFIDGTDGHCELPIDVIAPAQHGAEPVRGTRLRCYSHEAPDHLMTHGLRVTAPARSVLDQARWQRDDAAALAFVDAGLRHGLATKEELIELTRTMPRLHGIRRLRATLGWASSRAESRYESITRWHWLSAGFGWPLVNPEVYDLDGHFIGRPDLMDPKTGLCGEWQGADYHASLADRHRDAGRAEEFERAGLVSVPLWGPDLAAGRIASKLHSGRSMTRHRRRRWVVAAAPDAARYSIGLLARSRWGEPRPVTAPVERLYL